MRNKYREIKDSDPIGRAVIAVMEAGGPYRVRVKTSYRHLIPKQLARRPWQRTWQAEWDGCERAVRAYTRHGALTKAVRRQLEATKER
jgi:hypothetical protein